ncbi:hypothetical protein L9F63_025244, partial [Diploptera punctata]
MEEDMWRHFYEKIKESESKKEISEHDIRIQELDGGFFEKFGTLLKEQTEDGMAPVGEDPEPRNVEEQEEMSEGDSGLVLQDSDTEPEELDKNDLITDAMGWNHIIDYHFH